MQNTERGKIIRSLEAEKKIFVYDGSLLVILISLGTDSEKQEKRILLMCMKYLRSINKRC